MKRIKQVGAILLVILLVGLAVGAMVFSFLDTPWAKEALSICLYSAIAVPVLLYAMILVARVLRGRGNDKKIVPKKIKHNLSPLKRTFQDLSGNSFLSCTVNYIS